MKTAHEKLMHANSTYKLQTSDFADWEVAAFGRGCCHDDRWGCPTKAIARTAEMMVHTRGCCHDKSYGITHLRLLPWWLWWRHLWLMLRRWWKDSYRRLLWWEDITAASIAGLCKICGWWWRRRDLRFGKWSNLHKMFKESYNDNWLVLLINVFKWLYPNEKNSGTTALCILLCATDPMTLGPQLQHG